MNSAGRAAELQRFKAYLAGKVADGKISLGTMEVYADAVQRWLFYVNGGEPTAEAAQSYIDALAGSLSASTVSLRAHAIVKWFKSRGVSIELECPTIRYPSPKYLKVDKIKKLLESCNTLLETVLITVLFDTAVRISELLNLRVDGIDWEEGFISVVRKGGRCEEVNISPKAMSVLKEWLSKRQSRSEKVFDGISYDDAWRIMKKVGKRAGIEVSPHMFRHSRAIQMLMSGRSLHDVQNHLGHANIATTANIYGRFKAVDMKGRIPTW